MFRTNTALRKASALAVSAACVVSFGFAPVAFADTDTGVIETAAAGDSDQDAVGSSEQDATDSATQPGTDGETTPSSVTKKLVMHKGGTQTITFASTAGTVKAVTSNKKIVKVAKSGKRKFKLKAVKNGKATVTFTSSKLSGKYKAKITVASGSSYVNKWVKNVANEITAASTDAKTRLLNASAYIIANFSYANIYGDEKVISKQKGNCNSAGRVLVKIYEAMGYKAKLRSAIHDNMSRYPSGITFGSDHYNVQVKAKGKTYYLDATPGMGFAYISTSKKPLAEYMYTGSGWMRIL